MDQIQENRRSQEDNYQINLLTTQAEMSWFQPNDVQYAHMNRSLMASTQAHIHAHGRLMQHDIETRRLL